jgi:hypothetical protein
VVNVCNDFTTLLLYSLTTSIVSIGKEPVTHVKNLLIINSITLAGLFYCYLDRISIVFLMRLFTVAFAWKLTHAEKIK